ncbi:MAG: hypothetical protein Q7S65_06030 [Nanoarchaeota archaeon]|nr:hypothetical protein [Nanoarchaeota archaeon]
MGKMNAYISQRLRAGDALERIEEELVKAGYPRRAAQGALFSHQKRARLLQWTGVAALGAVLILGIIIGGSGVAGMLTYEYARTYTDTLDTRAAEPGELTWAPSVPGELASVALTGTFSGGGRAMVYLVDKDNKPSLILDTEQDRFVFTEAPGDQRAFRFERICHETCALENLKQAVYTFRIEVDDSVIELESVTFAVRNTQEQLELPRWQNIPEQQMHESERALVDLSTYFPAAGAQFRALTSDSAVRVETQRALATITALKPGIARVYFIADVDGATYLSNLVPVEVLEGESTGVREVKNDAPLPETPPAKKSNASLILLFFFLFAAVIAVGGFIAAKGIIVRRLLTKEEAVFNELAGSFKHASPAEQEAFYNKMKSLYEKMLAHDIPKKEKKRMYRILMGCYRGLQ